jgi:hypothetical protein
VAPALPFFRYPPTLPGGAEDRYGIEERDRIQISS